MMNLFVQISFFLALIFQTAKCGELEEELCPLAVRQDGDYYLRVRGNYCYQFVMVGRVDYNTAEARCSSYGGSLVTIPSSEVNNFLSKTLLEDFRFSGLGVWIGLRGLDDSGTTFVWSDGRNLTDSGYSNWASNKDLFAGKSQDCVAISPSLGGKWYVFECETGPSLTTRFNAPYICKYHIQGYNPNIPDSETTASTNTITTESDGTSTASIEIIKPDVMTTVLLDSNNNRPHVTPAAILDANITTPASVTKDIIDATKTFPHATNTALLNTTITAGASTNLNNINTSVSASTTILASISSTSIKPTPAPTASNKPTSISKPLGSSCPDSLIQTVPRYLREFNNVCYQFVLAFKTNHNTAKFTCETFGGTLAIVKTKEVNNFLAETLRNFHSSYPNVWIGLQNFDQNGISYKWEDGSSLMDVGYSNWADFQGAGFEGKNCVVLEKNSGLWYDSHCTDQEAKNAYICQYSPQIFTAQSNNPRPATSKNTNKPTTSIISSTIKTPPETKAPLETKLPPATTSTTSSIGSPTICPPFNCDTMCGFDGYRVDVNGCSLCECAK